MIIQSVSRCMDQCHRLSMYPMSGTASVSGVFAEVHSRRMLGLPGLGIKRADNSLSVLD